MKTPLTSIVLPGLKNGINNLKTDFGRIVKQSAGDVIPDQITDTLYASGTLANGKQLETDKATAGRKYAYNTFKIKAKKGHRISNVTLIDTGEFYKSVRIISDKNAFRIVANFNKENGHIARNFRKMFGSNKEFETSVFELTKAEWDMLYSRYLLRPLKEKIIQNQKKK